MPLMKGYQMGQMKTLQFCLPTDRTELKVIQR